MVVAVVVVIRYGEALRRPFVELVIRLLSAAKWRATTELGSVPLSCSLTRTVYHDDSGMAHIRNEMGKFKILLQ